MTPLEFTIIMDSEVEEVLSFKTCCSAQVMDPNLEIRVSNNGTKPVTVKSQFDLQTEDQTIHFPCLYPPGSQQIPPGETRAFYCQMEEAVWQAARKLTFQDSEGTRYPVLV